MDTAPYLKELIGRLVVMKIPALDESELVFVKLLRLEAAGVWVESHRYNQEMLERYDMPESATTLVLFVPYASVAYVVSSVQKIALSESAFGLDE